jgi:tRNA modification GTPase
MLKKTFDQQQQIRQGIRIVLVGSVNAGKSSLFNALLAQERAIVTDIAGTTRDVLEAGLYVNGNYWTLIDTAGLRKTHDVIEQEGIRRSHEQAQKADIVLLVYDRSQALTAEEESIYQDIITKYNDKVMVIANKADLNEWPNKALQSNQTIHVSSQYKENIDAVHDALTTKIASLFKSIESPYLLNQRHFNVLLELEKNLRAILPMLDGSIQYELLSCHLSDALESLTELTGKTISEQGMDKVFREFCVGK